MLKLTKISKVFLTAGLLTVFSCGLLPFVSKAQETPSETMSWEQAAKAQNDAKNEYTKASVAYNDCLAKGGNCAEEKGKMDKAQKELSEANKTYETAQKQASKDYYKNEKAQAKAQVAAEKAESKQLKKDQKDLKNAQKELEKLQKTQEKCKDEKYKDKNAEECAKATSEAIAAAQSNVAKAQNTVDSHKVTSIIENEDQGGSALEEASTKYEEAEKAYEECASSPEKKECAALWKEMERAREAYGAAGAELQNSIKNKQQEASFAASECERYSALTSQAGKAKAQEACAQKARLEAEVKGLEKEYDKFQKKNGMKLHESVLAAAGKLNTTTASYSSGEGGYGVVDIKDSRELKGISTQGKGEGYYFNYTSGADVLDTVTRRAALAIVGLKPIVYTFAGFGLIAFAWMAVFGKLSWKWFGNIAMGLFLVANMGRFIEYFVAGDGGYHYYVGEWRSATSGSSKNQLANAFHDVYYVYGDVQTNQRGVRRFTEMVPEAEESAFQAIFKPNARGFCQGTSASLVANFKTCMDDVVATAKASTDTVKDTKAAIEDVRERVTEVKDKVANIKDAAQNMKGASLTDIAGNVNIILSNAGGIVSTTTGAVGSLTGSMVNASNHLQNIGKSTDQQKELADRRASGEATNAFNALLMGQEFDKSTGGVEKVDGQYADKANAFTNIAAGVSNFAAGTSDIGRGIQAGIQQAGAVTNIVENTSLNDLTFGISKNRNTLNSLRQEKNEAKAAAEKEAQNKKEEEKREQERALYLTTNAGINETYREMKTQTATLESEVNRQIYDLNTLEAQKKEAAQTREEACKDEKSAACSAAKALETSANKAYNDKQSQLKATEEAYKKAQDDLKKQYEKTKESNIKETQKAYEEMKKKADDICAKNAAGKDCEKARQEALQKAQELASYAIEPASTSSIPFVSGEKAASDEKDRTYREQTEAASRMYTTIKTQISELENLKAEEERLSKEVAESCAGNLARTPLCKQKTDMLAQTNKAMDEKQRQIGEQQKEYAKAKGELETAYMDSLNGKISAAEASYERAKEKAEKACGENVSGKDCAEARKEQLTLGNQLTGLIEERDKHTNESRYLTTEDIENKIAASEEAYEQKRLENILKYEQEQEAIRAQIAAAEEASKLKRTEDLLKYEQEQEAIRSKTEAVQADQAYGKAVDSVSTLYAQINNQTQEVRALEIDLKNKQAAASAACAKDAGGAVCTTAKTAVSAAEKALENKKQQLDQSKKQYETAQKTADKAYNQAVASNISQAQRDYENAQKQILEAERQRKDADSKIDSAQRASEKAEKDYDDAKKAALTAKENYDKAVANGASEEEILRLKKTYEVKLAAMQGATETYREKSSAYQEVLTQKQNAEKAYNEAFNAAKEAGEKLASYTNERDNKTNESRKATTEETVAQGLVGQYMKDSSTAALAQASKNNYIQSKEKTSVAEQKLKQKQATQEEAKLAYEQAQERFEKTGDETDRKVLERLQKTYELAGAEVEEAKKDYQKAADETKAYEAKYTEAMKADEKYKQQSYQEQMKQATEQINTFEKQAAGYRKEADELATKYMQAKSRAEQGGSEEIRVAAEIYAKYKALKQAYDSANQQLNAARQKYQTAQKGYQQATENLEKLGVIPSIN